MKICSCDSDAYWSDGKCRKCAGSIDGRAQSKKEYKPFPGLPDETRDLTYHDWRSVNPWPHFPEGLAIAYDFYPAQIGAGVYIVMPVYRGNNPVFFAARLIAGDGPKYVGPKDCKKEYWLSSEYLEHLGQTGNFAEFNERNQWVAICEGIADAAYMSQWMGSVALLGMNYDGSLDDLLRHKNILVCLDGDARGRLAAVKLATQLLSTIPLGDCRVLNLWDDHDPTDLSYSEMEGLLREQGIM